MSEEPEEAGLSVYARQWRDGRCALCRRPPTARGHDPCIADLPGVKNACCGHGVRRGYVALDNGLVIRGVFDHMPGPKDE